MHLVFSILNKINGYNIITHRIIKELFIFIQMSGPQSCLTNMIQLNVEYVNIFILFSQLICPPRLERKRTCVINISG